MGAVGGYGKDSGKDATRIGVDFRNFRRDKTYVLTYRECKMRNCHEFNQIAQPSVRFTALDSLHMNTE